MFLDLKLHWEGESLMTHPFKVAHSLEVDKVALARIQRAIPVAIVSVIVPYGEGAFFWQTAGGQLCRVVVWRASGLGLAMRHGQRETILKAQLSLHFLHSLLLNHHLVSAGVDVQV